MNIYTQEQIDGFDKKALKGYKVKQVKWSVDFKNNLEPKYYCSIKELADDNPLLNYDTWRNIAVGRSKVYKNFINLENVAHKKLYHSSYEEKPVITEKLDTVNQEPVITAS